MTAAVVPSGWTERVNELASLGVILLVALLAGHVVKFLGVPEVTGYILAGVLLGPAGAALVSHEALESLKVFSEVALGLILFSIGSVFELAQFRRVGRGVALLTAVESLLTATMVGLGLLAVGQPLTVALLLGVIAMETAAASTLMVMRECNSDGPLTQTLAGVIALNNIVCLTGFLVVAAGLDLVRQGAVAGVDWTVLYRTLYPLAWQLVGSAALGFVVGVLLAVWASKVIEHGAPLYAIFFVIAGADLNLSLLPSIGLIGGSLCGRANRR